MFDVLRDPAWNGIAGIATILALLFAVFQDKSVRPFAQKTLSAARNACVGILIVFPGISVEMTIESLLNGGTPLIIREWQEVLAFGFLQWIWISLAYSIFPGAVTALVAATENTLIESRKRAIASAFITLWLTDIALAFVIALGLRLGFSLAPLTFTLLSDIFGGVIIGYLVSYILITIRNHDIQQTQNTSNVGKKVRAKK